MKGTIDAILADLQASGNLRTVALTDADAELVDLSSNDYLGLAASAQLREDFFKKEDVFALPMSASASRLLAAHQNAFSSLENRLSKAYGSPVLLFNSGYHANTGMVSALGAVGSTFIIADKLVHASIIDGIKLSGAPFARFRHNDYTHLATLARKAAADYNHIVIIAESVYSMDGDNADIDALAEVKRSTPGAMLYIDEAHAVGVEGPAGLGLAEASPFRKDIDIVVGTFGKALASAGAYAVVSATLRNFFINKARSFIFSTALPHIMAAWSEHVLSHMLEMDSARSQLKMLGQKLASILSQYGTTSHAGHIQPLIAGNPEKAVAWSKSLRSDGFIVLPIRTPTVPPGTDRLRFSIAANIDPAKLDTLSAALSHLN